MENNEILGDINLLLNIKYQPHFISLSPVVEFPVELSERSKELTLPGLWAEFPNGPIHKEVLCALGVFCDLKPQPSCIFQTLQLLVI